MSRLYSLPADLKLQLLLSRALGKQPGATAEDPEAVEWPKLTTAHKDAHIEDYA